MAQTKKPTAKREPDIFSLARRIYKRRQDLIQQYADALDTADERVKAIVSHLEETDAKTDQRFAEVDPDLPADD